MQDLDSLHLKERLLVCRRAEQRCARVFRDLARRIPVGTDGAHAALLKLAHDEDEHLRLIETYDSTTPWPCVWTLSEQDVAGLVDRHLPGLSAPLPPAPVDAAAASSYVRRVESESRRFYEQLAVSAPDGASRAFFLSLAAYEASHGDLSGGTRS